jgi:1-deoxy-D-xylulose-5-phosphate synthase
VVAIYSTFLQRGFDGIVHDVALQDLPVVFALDRAGVAGADGPTHHGTLDINYMLSIPGMTVTAPKDGAEMMALLRLGVTQEKGPFSVRWPRDRVPEPVPPLAEIPEIRYGTWEVLRAGKHVAVLAVGTMVRESLTAAEALKEEGIEATVVNCRFLKPLDQAILESLLRHHTRLLTVEEGAVVNGFGAYLARELEERDDASSIRLKTLGIPDRFVTHGARDRLLREMDLDAEGIAKLVRQLVGEAGRPAEGAEPVAAASGEPT